MEGGILALCKHDAYPPFLMKAIDIAMALLNQVSSLDTKVSLATATRLHNTTDIAFRANEKGEYGWTTSSQDVIFVNEVMRDRLELLTKKRKKCTNEYHSLVFMIAVVIVQGCANLLAKWDATARLRGVPARIQAFRAHVDTSVFKGQCRLLLQKPPEAPPHAWTKTMRVMGLVVQQTTRNAVINAHALRDFISFVPGDLRVLGPLKKIEIKRPKVAVIHLDIRPDGPVIAQLQDAETKPPRKKRRTN